MYIYINQENIVNFEYNYCLYNYCYNKVSNFIHIYIFQSTRASVEK